MYLCPHNQDTLSACPAECSDLLTLVSASLLMVCKQRGNTLFYVCRHASGRASFLQVNVAVKFQLVSALIPTPTAHCGLVA